MEQQDAQRSLTAQERENRLNHWRQFYQEKDNRYLSNQLSRLINTPSQFNRYQKKALLMTAASRLWSA